MSSGREILRVDNIVADYVVREGLIRAVDYVTLAVLESEVLGLVGESGSGKTTLIQAVTRVGPYNMKVKGRVLFEGKNLLEMEEKELRKIRGRLIAQVFQAAQNSLNPFIKVWDHFLETYRSHYPDVSEDEVRERAVKLLGRVGLDERVLSMYPHQLSGGMKQRVVIALALLLDPRLVFLDEPVSALDLITQKQVLRYLLELKKSGKTTMVYVTHDIESLFELADRLAILYAGVLVEEGDTSGVVKEPLHPYTQGLMRSLMTVDVDVNKVRSIPGSPPSLLLHLKPKGCPFVDRCPHAASKCRDVRPGLREVEKGRKVACHLYG
ncbi:MAG: ABC transporter ATP-binding protein [Thermofilaceae archaeon]